MNLTDALIYLINCYNRVGQLPLGITYYTSGGIQKSINRLTDQHTHIDMTNADDYVYQAMGVSVYCMILLNLVNIVVTILTGGLLGTLAAIFKIVGLLILTVVSVALCGLVITAARKNVTHWNKVFISLIIILGFIAIVIQAISIISGVFALFRAIRSISWAGPTLLITSLFNLASIVITLMYLGLLLQGLNGGNPINIGVTNQTGFGEPIQGGFTGFGQQSQGFNQGFGQQGQPQDGFGDFDQGFGQQQQEFQTHQAEQSFEQGSQQMYQCPYCGQAIHYGVNPCPYCNNNLNW